MRITNNTQEYKDANSDCKSCPLCKESSSFYIDKVTGKARGILTGLYSETYVKFRFPKIKRYKKDKYKCFSCGCEWESEPYLSN